MVFLPWSDFFSFFFEPYHGGQCRSGLRMDFWGSAETDNQKKNITLVCAETDNQKRKTLNWYVPIVKY